MQAEGGLCNLHLGPGGRSERCAWCRGTDECPGHFGRIHLEEPVFHVGFMSTIIMVLNCICLNCSRLKIPTTKTDKQKRKKYENIVRDALLGNKRVKRDYEKQGALKKRLKELSEILKSIRECSQVQRIQQQQQEGGEQGIAATALAEAGHLDIEKRGICGERKLPINIRQDGAYKINIEQDDGKKVQLTAKEVLEIFKRIDRKELEILGFLRHSKPQDMIIQELLVPPPQVRPAVEYGSSGKKQHDDLTKAYKLVLRMNDAIRTEVQVEKKKTLVDNLTSFIYRIFDNQKDNAETLTIGDSKKKLKSIKERLKGKEGRVRMHLMGKRVDFCARSVISPDANLALDELGVPRSLALELTVRDPVTHYNLEYIRLLHQRDEIQFLFIPKHEGEFELVEASGYDSAQKFTKINPTKQKINYGMIVERNLQNGDFVLFNRQPTLHKMSMMGHRVRILPYSTFRLNLSVTTPYNADFDGDEMNMHVPQSYESYCELKNICHVPRQIISPKANKPVMGLVQDSLLGIALFTLRDTFLTKDQVMNLTMWIDNENWEGRLPMPAIFRPEPLWTGKQLISMIIPQDIQLEILRGEGSDKYFSENDQTVIVQKGELLQGVMMKSIVGDGAGGLVHTIWLDLGPDQCCLFMTQAQRIVNNWLVMSGATISCSDIVPPAAVDRKIQEIISDASKSFKETTLIFQSEQLIKEKNLYKSAGRITEAFESRVNSLLNKVLEQSNKEAIKDISFRYNNFQKMVWAGSKGKMENLSQVLGIVGQQNIEGQRISLGFSKRTLPHFSRDNHGLEARGFVKQNFYRGLSPSSFFFHTMGGREGLSDTAVKTSRTGYIQRKLIKAIEDVKVCYDGSVRDSTGSVIQFLYGEDGLAAEYIEKQSALEDAIKLKEPQLAKTFRIFHDYNRDLFETKINQEIDRLSAIQDLTIENLQNEQQVQRIKEQARNNPLEEEYYKILRGRQKLVDIFMRVDKIQDIYLPGNLQRMIKQIKADQTRVKKTAYSTKCALNPVEVYQKVRNLIDQLKEMYSRRHAKDSIKLFKIHLRYALASKRICLEHKLDADSLAKLVNRIQIVLTKAQAHAGESVGAIAAQSIGEPTTQMTLNTFHFAGNSEKNVTLGVPRLQELLNASKKIKLATVNIHLNKSQKLIYVKKKKDVSQKKEGKVRTDEEQYLKQYRKEKLNQLLLEIPKTKLRDIIVSSDIIYQIAGEGQQDFFEDDENGGLNTCYPWCLRFHLKSDFVRQQQDKVNQAFKKYLDNNIFKHNIVEGDYPYYSISTKRSQDEEGPASSGEKALLLLMDMEKVLREDLDIQGIDNIQKIYQKKISMPYWFEKHRSDTERNLQSWREPASDQIYKEYYFESTGTNLKKLLAMEIIDTKRTISNDIYEIYNTLGVEAARAALISETKWVFAHYGIYVNYRHIALLIDWMTRRGGITPCSRDGINRVPNVSALRKASFEETVEMLFEAAIFSELDHMRGVSENIIFGQTCKIGTGVFDVVVDTSCVHDFKGKADRTYNIIDENQQEMDEENSGPRNGLPNMTPIVIQTPANYTQTPDYYSKSLRSPGIAAFTPGITTPLQFGSLQSPRMGSSDLPQASPAYMASQMYTPTYQAGSIDAYSPAIQSAHSRSDASPNSQGNSPSYYSASSAYAQSSVVSPGYSPSVQSPAPSVSGSQNRASPQGGQTSAYHHSPSSPRYNITSSVTPGNQHSSHLSGVGSQAYSPQYQSSSIVHGTQQNSYGANSHRSGISPLYNAVSGSLHVPVTPVSSAAGQSGVYAPNLPVNSIQPQNEPESDYEEEHDDEDEQDEDDEGGDKNGDAAGKKRD